MKMQIKKLVLKNRFLSSLIKPIYFNFNKRKNFDSGEYWRMRYLSGGTSGDGSYGNLSVFKAEIINTFIQTNKVNSIIEFGCGDGNQLSLLKISNYIGFDISEKSIELCIHRFRLDASKSFFLYSSQHFVDNLGLFKADLTLSLDVIYHLIEMDIYEKYMSDLFSSSKKYVIIYSSNTCKQEKHQAQHVFHRNFSDLIEKNFPEWQLIEQIKNEFPEETFADFYIYMKIDIR